MVRTCTWGSFATVPPTVNPCVTKLMCRRFRVWGKLISPAFHPYPYMNREPVVKLRAQYGRIIYNRLGATLTERPQ